MRIMLQNHTFFPALGGIENYLYHVSKVLQKMGHQPMILCEKHDERLSVFDIFDGIPIVRHPYYNIPKPLLFIKPKLISSQLKHFVYEYAKNVDLIISRYPHYCYATCLLDIKVPIFYIPATLYWRYIKRASEASELKEKFFNFLWKPMLDHLESKSIIMSKEVITLSQHISKSLAQYYGFDSRGFVLNPPGVDLDRFTKPHCSMEVRREFNIPKNRVVVIYVGRLSTEKNVEKLIRDFSQVKGKNVHLLIVGYGPERSKLGRLVNELAMVDRITFVGLREDVERFYAAADIFFLPSKYEAFGQVILEAMAAGLPCIAFKRAWPEYEVASEEIIRDRVTGFCVDPYNNQELQERLLYLIDNPDIRIRMGKAGREECKKKFTWEHHVKRLLDLATS